MLSRRTTLLELIRTVQDCTQSDEDAVAAISELINTGRVILHGIFPSPKFLYKGEKQMRKLSSLSLFD